MGGIIPRERPHLAEWDIGVRGVQGRKSGDATYSQRQDLRRLRLRCWEGRSLTGDGPVRQGRNLLTRRERALFHREPQLRDRPALLGRHEEV
jgi:hypothetical protein